VGLADIKFKKAGRTHIPGLIIMMYVSNVHRLPQEAAVFIRGSPKNSDINTLTEIVSFLDPNFLPPLCLIATKKKTREGWVYRCRAFRRCDSQLYIIAFPGHTTSYIVALSMRCCLPIPLGQLYDVIYCPSNELPDESTMDETFIGYQPGPSKDPSGCAVVIEGIAYGDGLTEKRLC